MGLGKERTWKKLQTIISIFIIMVWTILLTKIENNATINKVLLVNLEIHRHWLCVLVLMHWLIRFGLISDDSGNKKPFFGLGKPSDDEEDGEGITSIKGWSAFLQTRTVNSLWEIIYFSVNIFMWNSYK